MRFAIDIGHNLDNDTGATGLRQEDALTLAVGTKLIELLKQSGHKVVSCLPKSALSVGNSLRQRVKKANVSHANIFVSIHFNAFNGRAYGSEVYALSSVGQGIGRRVLAEICQLGYYDRGVKSANFYVLKHTKMPAILVECCFVDSPQDMAIFDADKMARAICQGLIGKIPEEADKTPGKLIVTHKTLLKPSTEQSGYISKKDMKPIEPGEYQLLNVEASEEGHFSIELEEIEGRWFIFSRHVRVEES